MVRKRRSCRVWLPANVCRFQRRMWQASTVWHCMEWSPLQWQGLLWFGARVSAGKRRDCQGWWPAGVRYCQSKKLWFGTGRFPPLPSGCYVPVGSWELVSVALSSRGVGVKVGDNLELDSTLANTCNNLPFPESVLMRCSICSDVSLLCLHSTCLPHSWMICLGFWDTVMLTL